MRIDLDARIRFNDGSDAGALQWVVLDTQTTQVTHIVLATDPDGDPDVLVPREEVDGATVEGDVVTLRVGPEALSRFPTTLVAGAGQIGIGKGASVVDAGGQDIGVAEQVDFEDQTGTLHGFTVRRGGPLRTLMGGGDRTTVAATQVERVGESTISLNVIGDQLPAPAS